MQPPAGNESTSSQATDSNMEMEVRPVTRRLTSIHYCLLSLPCVGLLLPFLYARSTPTIFGIPFFYAYQFSWIPLSAFLTAIVYRDINTHD